MPAACEVRHHPRLHNFQGQLRAYYPCAEAEDVSVVVLAAQAGGKGFMAERGPDVAVPVGGDGHTDAGAADEDAALASP